MQKGIDRSIIYEKRDMIISLPGSLCLDPGEEVSVGQEPMWLLASRLFLRNSVLSSSGTKDTFPNSDKEDALAHLHLTPFF